MTLGLSENIDDEMKHEVFTFTRLRELMNWIETNTAQDARMPGIVWPEATEHTAD